MTGSEACSTVLPGGLSEVTELGLTPHLQAQRKWVVPPPPEKQPCRFEGEGGVLDSMRTGRTAAVLRQAAARLYSRSRPPSLVVTHLSVTIAERGIADDREEVGGDDSGGVGGKHVVLAAVDSRSAKIRWAFGTPQGHSASAGPVPDARRASR